MSIENKLTYLDGTKDAIKQAIIDKGVSVTEEDTFRSYATKIGEIQTSGGGGDCPKGVLDLSDGVSNTFILFSEIKNIVLPTNMDNVTNMDSCFYNLTSLSIPIKLPESMPNLKTIEDCFRNCSSLTSITLPTNATSLTNISYAFADCRNLTSITLPTNIGNIGSLYDTFDGCSVITSIKFPPSMNYVTNMYSTFAYCTKLSKLELPELNNVTMFNRTFYNCKSLTSITLPSSLTKVTNMNTMFDTCASLKYFSYTYPLPLLKDIGVMFARCSSITSITLPDLPSLSSVGYCFEACTSLRNLVIGNINPNITTLTNWYISNCTALTVDSLVNIMNALPTITNTRTCTIGTTNISKLSPEQLAIATDKGWSIN